jgi:hypothetical protein
MEYFAKRRNDLRFLLAAPIVFGSAWGNWYAALAAPSSSILIM